MTLDEYVSRFADSAGTLLKVDGGSAAALPEIHPHEASVRQGRPVCGVPTRTHAGCC